MNRHLMAGCLWVAINKHVVVGCFWVVMNRHMMAGCFSFIHRHLMARLFFGGYEQTFDG